MCIQNSHGCVFLISITGEKYVGYSPALYEIQLYVYLNNLKTRREDLKQVYIHMYTYTLAWTSVDLPLYSDKVRGQCRCVMAPNVDRQQVLPKYLFYYVFRSTVGRQVHASPWGTRAWAVFL